MHVVCPHCAAINRVPHERLNEAPDCGRCHRALFEGYPVNLDANAFERHMTRNDIPLLVDFWAPWCGPCRTMAAAFGQAAAQLEPHFRLAKINTEEEQGLAARYGIRSIPTMVLFLGGREIARQLGAMGLGDIVGWARQSNRSSR
jgi:thioredoxin 2